MYIIDGIAYAGEQKKPISVKAVRPLDGYKLLVRFMTDEQKIFDFMPLLDKPCFAPLEDKAVFDRAYVDYGTVTWNDGEIDIAPERLYSDGVSVSNQDIA